jgi:hypothetical protein
MNNILPTVIVFVMVFCGIFSKTYMNARKQSKNPLSINRLLEDFSTEFNAKLPMQIDDETRLDAIIPGPDKQLTYIYTLVGHTAGDIESNTLVGIIQPMLINNYRNMPAMELFRREQVELHYQYRDRNGKPMAAIVVSPRNL